ncbi:MAG TPA: hypothetical protein VIK16_05850, partial [Candidatus Limnocylindrales bacterium]
EEELALSQSRTAARIADLFGHGAAAPAEAPLARDASPDVVEDDAEAGVMPSSAFAGPGPWPGGPRPPIVVEGDADVVGVATGTGQVELVGVMARSGDHVGDDNWELFLAESLLTLDPGLSDATTADEAAVEPRTAAPIGPSHRGSSHDRRRRSAAGRSPATRTTRTKVRSAPVPTAFCPSCALLLHPPPTSSRRCMRCRQRIIVKRVEGRAVYLTEAAVLVFEAERRRVTTSGRLTRERERWLRLAAAAGAPAQHQARLAAAPLSEKAVGAARTLYLGTVDRAFRAAKRDHEWETASRIRREQAATLHRVAGSPLPPPADLVALFREGVVAELRGIAEISRDAELVSASCCDVCRADDRLIFGIARELRTPRLPHEGCPRGLCRCGWDLATRDRTTMRRYLRRRPRTESQAAPDEPAPTA